MILQSGDRGPEVVKLQLKLMERGYSLPRWGADGVYGAETASAVTSYQLDHNLSPTGMADTKTYNSIMGIKTESAVTNLVSTLLPVPTSTKQTFSPTPPAKPSFLTNLMSLKMTPTNIAIFAGLAGLAYWYLRPKKRRS